MAGNRVTIFSNGIADFQRSYTLSADAAQEITIPVKSDHVADVLSSLNVYGPVTLQSPPSFRPANENDSNLSINPGDVLQQLATRLSGSQVLLEKASGSVAGTLVGLHTEQEGGSGERIAVPFLIVLTEEGFTKMPLRELQRLRFTDQDVRAEIDKALKRNFQEIKPGSTFITLSLSTEQPEAEAVLQYTIPAAAWKISYRLRREESGDGNRFEFQGFAVVDNTTDEDWTDFLVSVVTGEPITFSTDLAESKIPHRDHVNVVKDRALGSVEVEDVMPALAVMPMRQSSESVEMAASARSEKKMRKASGRGGFSRGAGDELESARMDEAEVQAVGDFCVFEAKQPVTILANRSAVIPMFQSTLSDTQTVLHYKHENHPGRPYRSVRFKNETEHSLGRGVCTVYESGVYGGSCILPATPASETCLLPHALETGVKIRREIGQQESRTVGLRISDGVCHTSRYERVPTQYHLQNLKEESFEVILDHEFVLSRPKLSCNLQRSDGSAIDLDVSETLKNGVRLSVALGVHEQLVIRIEETKVRRSQFHLITDNNDKLPGKVHWIGENIVDSNGPLANDPAIQNCLAIQKRLDAKLREIDNGKQEVARLTSRQERLRKNLGTGGQNEQADRWRADLAESENRITDIEDNTLPALHEEAAAIRAELRDALSGLSLDWQEPQ